MGSFSSLVLSFFVNRSSILFSCFLSVEFNSFSIIYNFSEMNWLSDVFFSRNINFSSFCLVLDSCSSSYWFMIDSFSFTSVHVNYLLNSFLDRLNILFSNSNSSWNLYLIIFSFGLVINYRFSGNSLSIYWSFYNFSSLNWSLNNLLSNDRLLNDSFSNYWLRNNFSCNSRSRFNFLSLGDNWLTEISLLHISSAIVGLTSLTSLNISFKGRSFLRRSTIIISLRVGCFIILFSKARSLLFCVSCSLFLRRRTL